VALLKISVIQINSGSDKAKNLAKAEKFILEACSQQAQFIALPEVFNLRGVADESIDNAEDLNSGETIQLIKKLARENQVWILAGSLMIKAVKGLPYNTSLLISAQGEITASYKKIHLFDMTQGSTQIRESLRNQSGTSPQVATLSIAGQNYKLGMSICYDLRFPELYRKYAEERVELITVPSAFTHYTGQAHWQVLCRARAIENQAYVIAPNQCGAGGAVRSYGHSLIVDPWGEILAEASGDKEEIIYADIDLNRLNEIRSKLPVLEHRRL
jgi:deaminated glutathione amidase